MWKHHTLYHTVPCDSTVLPLSVHSKCSLAYPELNWGFPDWSQFHLFFSVRARFLYSAPTINLQSTSKSCFTTRWAAFPNSCLFYLLAPTHSCPLQTWYLSPKNNVVNFQLWFSKSHHNGGGRPGRQDNQFSNWTKGKTFWPSLPERCFYIGHSPRDNYTKFLFFCVTHRPFFLLLDYSPIICASVKRTFLLHKNCLKKIRLVKLGLAPLRCHLPILGEQATSAREAAVPLFSHLSLCLATLQISYPILGPALSYFDQPLKVLQDSGRVDIDL